MLLVSPAYRPSDTPAQPECASAAFNPANNASLPENAKLVSTEIPEERVSTSSAQYPDSAQASSNTLYSQNSEFPQYMTGTADEPQYTADAGGSQYAADAADNQYTADAAGSQYAPSSSYQQTSSDDIDYSQCMTPGVDYSQPLSEDAIDSQSTSSGVDYSQPSSGDAVDSQSTSSGVDYSQPPSEDAADSQSTSSGVDYSQPPSGDAVDSQSTSSGVDYSQPFSGDAVDSQSTSSGVDYSQPSSGDAVDSQSTSSGVDYLQPSSGDAASTFSVNDFSQFGAAPCLPLPNAEWSGGLVDDSTQVCPDAPSPSDSEGITGATTNAGTSTEEPASTWNGDQPTPVAPPAADSTDFKKYEKELSLPISIIERERSVIHMLKGTSILYRSSVVPRISGGWIRDKILNRKTAQLEMDVSIDRMSGHAFGRQIRWYMKRNRIKAQIVKILKDKRFENPHLRSTLIEAFGIEISVTSLRKDIVLADGSKSISLGTPMQDAFRRDFTINTLYYNAMTHQIEDFTKRGLDDLRAGLIRTPLEAMVTLKADPLRVLRALRLAVELNMRIDLELQEAIQNPVIHEEMRLHVQPGRLGDEVSKAIKSNSFSQFVSLMGAPLFEVVFPLARNPAWTVEQASESVKFLGMAEQALLNSRWVHLCEQHTVFLLAALFIPRLPLSRALYSVLRRPVFRKAGQPDEIYAIFHCIIDHLSLSQKLSNVVCRVLCGSVVLLSRIAELETTHDRKFHELPLTEPLFDSRDDVYWFRYMERQWPVAAYLASIFHTVRNSDAKGDLAIEEAEKLFDRLASSPAAGVLRWNQQVSGADMAARFKGGAIARALDEAQYLFAMNQSLTKEQLLAKIDTEFVPPKTA